MLYKRPLDIKAGDLLGFQVQLILNPTYSVALLCPKQLFDWPVMIGVKEQLIKHVIKLKLQNPSVTLLTL